MRPPLYLILDTNVWLDWLVFDDPGVAPIKAAVECGRAQICIDVACEEELERVLAYRLRKLPLETLEQEACLAECRRISRKVEKPTSLGSRLRGNDNFLENRAPFPPFPCFTGEGVLQLPICRDPDDQMFLELARDCGAEFLITKDRALLELARTVGLPFTIVTPREFERVV